MNNIEAAKQINEIIDIIIQHQGKGRRTYDENKGIRETAMQIAPKIQLNAILSKAINEFLNKIEGDKISDIIEEVEKQNLTTGGLND